MAGSPSRALAAAIVVLLGCSGEVAGSDGTGGGGSGNATVSTGSGSYGALKETCKQFCDAYGPCAPVAACMNGCLVSAFHGCETEYTNDVVCITKEMVNCGLPEAKCTEEQSAYVDCEMMKSG